MKLNDYQKLSQQTDVSPGDDLRDLIIPLLGLAGETGSLLTEFKKSIRDGAKYRLFDEKLLEELGDILWYLANIAEKKGMLLEDVAKANLEKITEKWRPPEAQGLLPGLQSPRYDSSFPKHEQLPREFRAVVSQATCGSTKSVSLFLNGTKYGQDLTDNSRTDDGYRFHDVFHLAYLAILGWSPVSRRNFGLKRKSDLRVDEVEDGGRAIVLEEAVSALVFQYAEGRSFLKDYTSVDYDLIKMIRRMVAHLEVSRSSPSQWERAIVDGYSVWRQVLENERGVVVFEEGVFSFEPG